MPTYRISILGALEIRNADGSPRDTPRRQLCLLLVELATANLHPCEPGTPIAPASVPNLMRALWGDAYGRTSAGLHSPITRIRRALGDDIQVDLFQETYQINGITRTDVDVLDFVDRSRTEDPAEARELLSAKVWRGDPSQMYRSLPPAPGRGFIPASVWTPVLQAKRRLQALVDKVAERSPQRPADDDEHLAVITWSHVELAVDRIAGELQTWQPDLVVGINRGGAIFGGMLAKRIGRRFIGVIAYDVSKRGGLERVQTPDIPPDAAKILIVDEAHRSGLHMHLATADISDLRPGVDIRTAVIAKADFLRADDFPLPDYVAFRISGNGCMPWDPEFPRTTVETSSP